MEVERMKNNEIKKAIEDLERQESNGEDCEVSYDSCELAIQALKKQLNGGWTPVKERLPENDADCLVTTGNGEIVASEFYGYGGECQGFKEFPEGFWEIDTYGETVIAWQPLPEPYKEEICDGKDYL